MSTEPVKRQSVSGVTVRQMTEADSEFVGHLVYEAFVGKIRNVMGEASLPFIHDAICHPACLVHLRKRVFVAESEGKNVGVLLIRLPGDPPNLQFTENASLIPCYWRLKIKFLMWLTEEPIKPGRCCLEILAVTDGNRGKGVGQAMMAVAEQEAKKYDCKIIFLLVADGNRAKNLYERSGYAVVSRIDSWFSIRAKGSAFSVMEKGL